MFIVSQSECLGNSSLLLFFSFLLTNKGTVFEIFCLIFSIVATMGQERVERHNYIGKKCLFFLIPSTVIGKTHYRYTVQAHSSGQLRQHCRLFGSLIKAANSRKIRDVPFFSCANQLKSHVTVTAEPPVRQRGSTIMRNARTQCALAEFPILLAQFVRI